MLPHLLPPSTQLYSHFILIIRTHVLTVKSLSTYFGPIFRQKYFGKTATPYLSDDGQMGQNMQTHNF
jgi:hypothetical protein